MDDFKIYSLLIRMTKPDTENGPGYQQQKSVIKRQTANHNADESTPLLAEDRSHDQTSAVTLGVHVQDGRKKKQPSLFRAMARTFGPTLLRAHVMRLG